MSIAKMMKPEKPDNITDVKEPGTMVEPVNPEGEPDKSNEDKFMEEASQVTVPTSMLANQLRENINECINNSPLHIEYILEILRSACTLVEETAAKVAAGEYAEYQKSIDDLREKYGIR